MRNETDLLLGLSSSGISYILIKNKNKFSKYQPGIQYSMVVDFVGSSTFRFF